MAAGRHWLGERQTWVRLHRYAGLLTALFLTVAGLTGSILAFGHDIDAWLNPGFHQARSTAPPLGFDALAARIEASDPALRVDYVTHDGTPGRTALAFVSARAGRPPLGYDEVYVDPGTGEIQGRRARRACCLQAESFVPFMLQIHHSLYVPGLWGWWFMGGIALIWLVDSFVGVYLTLPRAGGCHATRPRHRGRRLHANAVSAAQRPDRRPCRPRRRGRAGAGGRDAERDRCGDLVEEAAVARCVAAPRGVRAEGGSPRVTRPNRCLLRGRRVREPARDGAKLRAVGKRIAAFAQPRYRPAILHAAIEEGLFPVVAGECLAAALDDVRGAV